MSQVAQHDYQIIDDQTDSAHSAANPAPYLAGSWASVISQIEVPFLMCLMLPEVSNFLIPTEDDVVGHALLSLSQMVQAGLTYWRSSLVDYNPCLISTMNIPSKLLGIHEYIYCHQATLSSFHIGTDLITHYLTATSFNPLPRGVSPSKRRWSCYS